MKKRRKWIKWALLAALVVVAALWAAGMQRADAARYTQVSVTSGDMTLYYNFDGLVKAPRQQTVTAQEGGTVKSVYAAQNERVNKGDRLLRMDGGQTVEAGMDGEITSLAVEAGSVVSAGETLARIIDMDRLNVEIEIDEYDIAAAQPGAPVEVRVLATDQVVSGYIASVDKSGTASGDLSYYKATVELDGAQGLYPGMQVSAKVLRAQVEGATLLRADAIQFDAQNQPYVLMAGDREGETVSVPVSVGMSDGVNCEILGGVTPGDTVLRPVTLDLSMLTLHMGS